MSSFYSQMHFTSSSAAVKYLIILWINTTRDGITWHRHETSRLSSRLRGNFKFRFFDDLSADELM